MTKPGVLERWREQRAERKQRRAWRRERRKGTIHADKSARQAEASNYQGGFWKK